MKYPPIVFLLVLEILLTPLSLYPESFPEKQKLFIRKLFGEKRYFETITETRRLISYLGEFPEKRSYEYFILGNYYLGGQYKSVIFNIKNFSPDLNISEKLLLSRSYLKTGLYHESYSVIKGQKYGNNREVNLSILRGKAEPLLLLGENDLLRKCINEADRSLQPDLYRDFKKDLLKYDKISYRSPVLGGILSAALPGAGQVYSGKYLPALISLLGVAAAAAGTRYFHEKGNREMTYTFGFFTLLFYTGNIYAGYNSAEGRNRSEEKMYYERLERKFFRYYSPLHESDLKKIFYE